LFNILKPCQNCKSFILKPKKKINLNLETISENIERFSFEILAFTGSMLSVKKDCKINIYNSGKVAIITKDLNRVQNLAKELETVLNEKKL
tara:strand:- start:3826 stop:4098 length:273 start_codon:yes stop_codon:yes gene_type:complete